MDYQVIKCKECGLVLNSLESLEVHRQYHEGLLMQQWTQEEKNNNKDEIYPPTPQSSCSPYQEYSFQNFQEGYYQESYQKSWRYNPYSRPVYSVNYPPQPTPSPSPKQCDKCGFVCENDVVLGEHNSVSHPEGLQYYYPKEEAQSEILDLDSQKVVSSWGDFTESSVSGDGLVASTYEVPVEVPPAPPQPPVTTKSTNWKSNEARRPKTYNCTACNKWFTSSGHLKRHYNTTLHKNAVKSSGQPDPATMPISAHHHPSRDSAASKDGQQEERVEVQQYPNELTPHVTQASVIPSSTTGDLDPTQPLPSFAQFQAQIQANVGGMGQLYAPQYTPIPEEHKENPPQPEQQEEKTKCYDCDKVFNRPCYLTQHNKTFHNGDKPFKCGRCGKRFPDDETYRRHARKHAGDKPHKCDVCPKMFNHKTDLRRHLCCHTGRKPYACQVCGKGFIRKDHMIKHTDTHARKREKMAAMRH